MYAFSLPAGVVAAFGVVYKSDPTPNPSLGRGLSRRDRDFVRVVSRDFNRVAGYF